MHQEHLKPELGEGVGDVAQLIGCFSIMRESLGWSPQHHMRAGTPVMLAQEWWQEGQNVKILPRYIVSSIQPGSLISFLKTKSDLEDLPKSLVLPSAP